MTSFTGTGRGAGLNVWMSGMVMTGVTIPALRARYADWRAAFELYWRMRGIAPPWKHLFLFLIRSVRLSRAYPRLRAA